MLLRWTTAALCAGFLIATANAQSLDGKKIVLTAKEHASINVPVSLPWDGKIGDGEIVRVQEPKTANEFPVTIRDGQFTFVPEGAMPGTEHNYVVKVRKDTVPPRVQMNKH